MRKGLSQIISVILMLIITISLISFAYINFSSIFRNAASEGTNQTEHAFQQMGAKLKIDSVTNRTVYIRNAGSVDIQNNTIGLYVNDVPVSYNLSKPIKVGETGMLQVPRMISGNKYTIRATVGKNSDAVYVKIP